MPETIKDRVAIIGVGCTRFTEHHDKSASDLIVDACYEAFEDAKVDPRDIKGSWIGTHISGATGQILAKPVKDLLYQRITHVDSGDNTGLDALKCASYAVLAKVYDVGLAICIEKTKPLGQEGQPPYPTAGSVTWGLQSSYAACNSRIGPVGQYAALATRYLARYGILPQDGKRMLAMITVKSNHNGLLNPKADLPREMTIAEVMDAPIIAWPLGWLDCSPVTDGAAAAIVVRAEDAKKFRADPVYIKALEFSVSTEDRLRDDHDLTHIEDSYLVGRKAYEVAGIKNPREEISIAEVDDGYNISEAISLEDLQFSPRGRVKDDIEAGIFYLEGKLPVQPDGGEMACGNPIAATGLRQVYEICYQLQGRAGPRQIKNPKLGLCHSIGGLLEPTTAVSGCGIFSL